MFFHKRNKSLLVITSYYNPCKYETRKINFDKFLNGLKKQGVECLTVECVFEDQEYELDPSKYNVIQMRTNTVLWQKERLLNLAAKYAENCVENIAWIDADLIFENDNWAQDLTKVLKQSPIAQTWQSCERLSKSGKSYPIPDVTWSFAHAMNQDSTLMEKQRYDAHGHTGYGWAMKKSIFEELGLYEEAISGSADHFMAHAIFDNYNHCIVNALKQDPIQIRHLQEWGAKFYSLVKGNLGVVPGHIKHLWHGEPGDRRYFLRMHDITDLGFNPYLDIEKPYGRPLEWAACCNKPELKQYFKNYFESRKED